MYYEINVAHNGVHLFATAPRSIVSPRKLEAVGTLFKSKFPESEGFAVEARAVPQESYRVDSQGNRL